MKEIKGDIFAQHDADAICVTTNTQIGRFGAVMGAGVAKQFALRYPTLQAFLGEDLRYRQGRVFAIRLPNEPRAIVNFPTKDHWKDPSPIELVEKSAKSLVSLADFNEWTKVVLTRPGCGLGGLQWPQVKAVLEPILDDRFIIVHRQN